MLGILRRHFASNSLTHKPSAVVPCCMRHQLFDGLRTCTSQATRTLIVRNALDGSELLRIPENDLEWSQNSEFGEEGRMLYSYDVLSLLGIPMPQRIYFDLLLDEQIFDTGEPVFFGQEFVLSKRMCSRCPCCRRCCERTTNHLLCCHGELSHLWAMVDDNVGDVECYVDGTGLLSRFKIEQLCRELSQIIPLVSCDPQRFRGSPPSSFHLSC